MKPSALWVLLLFTIFQPFPTLAHPGQVFVGRIDPYRAAHEYSDGTPPSIPKYVYHWLSLNSLGRFVDQTHCRGALPLKTVDPTFFVAKALPSLGNRPGLFTWSNPITGIAANLAEVYGRGEALLRIQLNPKKVEQAYEVQIEEGFRIPDQHRKKLLASDLLFFELFAPNDSSALSLIYQEWIILNAQIVQEWTFDPEVLTPELLKERKRLARSTRYSEDEIHHPKSNFPNTPEGRRFLIRQIDHYIKESAPRLRELGQRCR